MSLSIWGTGALASLDSRAKHFELGKHELGVVNTDGLVTHGDLALETNTDFLAVTEHRLIPSRARNEWSRLRQKGIQCVWSSANQDSSHVSAA